MSTPSIIVNGRPPDDWPENGVNGWGMGSRVSFEHQGETRVGIVTGAIKASPPAYYFEGDEWGISIRVDHRLICGIPSSRVRALE